MVHKTTTKQIQEANWIRRILISRECGATGGKKDVAWGACVNLSQTNLLRSKHCRVRGPGTERRSRRIESEGSALNARSALALCHRGSSTPHAGYHLWLPHRSPKKRGLERKCSGCFWHKDDARKEKKTCPPSRSRKAVNPSRAAERKGVLWQRPPPSPEPLESEKAPAQNSAHVLATSTFKMVAKLLRMIPLTKRNTKSVTPPHDIPNLGFSGQSPNPRRGDCFHWPTRPLAGKKKLRAGTTSHPSPSSPHGFIKKVIEFGDKRGFRYVVTTTSMHDL